MPQMIEEVIFFAILFMSDGFTVYFTGAVSDAQARREVGFIST